MKELIFLLLVLASCVPYTPAPAYRVNIIYNDGTKQEVVIYSRYPVFLNDNGCIIADSESVACGVRTIEANVINK